MSRTWKEKLILRPEFARGTGSQTLTAGLHEGEINDKERKYFRMTGIPARLISHIVAHAKPDVKATPDKLLDFELRT